jgi:hypothetical protein
MHNESEKDFILTEQGKKALIKALNERFRFNKNGSMTPKTENAYDPIILSDYFEEKNEMG